MLGLASRGILNGVAHLLAAQVDTAIPAVSTAMSPNDAQVRVERHPGVSEPEGQQKRNAMDFSAVEDSGRHGDVLHRTYSSYGADIVDDAVVLVNASGGP